MKTEPKPPAVFVSPHQDDELLFMGGAIRNHLTAGRDVHVVLLGRGDGTAVRTRQMPALLGRTPSPHEIGAMRDREFFESCALLGVPSTNVHVLPYEQRLPEKGFTAAEVVRVITATVPEGSDLKTTSPYDPNPDHVAAAQAIIALHRSCWTAAPPRFYVAASLKQDWPVRLSREGKVTKSHQHPYRHTDIPAYWWGVGYKSVRGMFEAQVADPSSYWHA